jgi:acyl-CoA thioesterase-1
VRRKVQPVVQSAALIVAVLVATLLPSVAQDRPVKIVALGDSLTAGYGLNAGSAFPVKLARALKERGIEATVVDAGVSGDTSTGGLERLDWSVPDDADAVIVELGGNDMLRGIDPAATRTAIDTIVRKLKEKRVAVLLCGMQAAPNLGPDYAKAFNAIFPEVAAAHGVLLYPFFLDGVAANRDLNQPDGIHPTAAGVDVIVRNILPSVEQLVMRAKKERG